jgi:hypothetical protein
MSGHRLDGRHAQGTTRADIEARTVARALDLTAVQLALGQGPTIVSANIVDGVESTLAVNHGEGATLHLDDLLTAGRELGTAGNLDE